MTNNTSNTNNTNKWDKLLGILLCLGVFIGLIYLSYSKGQKAEEFTKGTDKNSNISKISQGKSNVSAELKSKDKAEVETLNKLRNRLENVLKWNLDKEWEWKPFRAGNEVELKEIKNIEKDQMENIRNSYSFLRELIAKEIAVTVETHLLPDPRLSEEALNDFIKFWGHNAVFSEAIKKNIQYFASKSPQFNKQEIQIMADTRKFFSDKGKMEEIRQKIKEAKNLDNFFGVREDESLMSKFLGHLSQLEKIVQSLH